MNIQPTNNDYNTVAMRGKPDGVWKKIKDRIANKIIDKIPARDINNSEPNQKIDNFMSNPAGNRAILGVTALMTQPAIDYFNHRVDDETKTVSMHRTIAKIIVGTLVGIMVRGACFKAVKEMTKLNGTKKIEKLLLPDEEKIKDLCREKKIPIDDFISTYQNGLATLIGLAVMLVTNFKIDAPLTAYYTNKLNERSAQKAKAKTEVQNGKSV